MRFSRTVQVAVIVLLAVSVQANARAQEGGVIGFFSSLFDVGGNDEADTALVESSPEKDDDKPTPTRTRPNDDDDDDEKPSRTPTHTPDETSSRSHSSDKDSSTSRHSSSEDDDKDSSSSSTKPSEESSTSETSSSSSSSEEPSSSSSSSSESSSTESSTSETSSSEESTSSETSSSETSSDGSASDRTGSGSLSGGAIAGIVVGVVAFLMIVVGAAIVWIHKKRRMRDAVSGMGYSEYPEMDFTPSAPPVVQTRPPEPVYTAPPSQPSVQPSPNVQPQPHYQPYNYSGGYMSNPQMNVGSPGVYMQPQQPGGFHVVNPDPQQGHNPPQFMRNLDNP
ncbi:hypothetical protein EV183_005439 [Coemansia sp. RSA 2336]|nr:hypothetical protein EV183_005439 [Coemansia sp. RSA 2336]